MVGAVGEMASMKRRKLWETGEDGLCCSSSAIQTPIVFVVLLCCRLPPQTGGNGQCDLVIYNPYTVNWKVISYIMGYTAYVIYVIRLWSGWLL